MRINNKVLLITVALIYMFIIILLPTFTVFYEALSKGFDSFLNNLTQRDFIEAVKLSVIITAITLPLNTIFGLCAAWVIARNKFPGKSLLISVIDLPFSVSPVVAGLMIVLVFGSQGWFGDWLQNAGMKIIFALPGMVIATIFVTLPFVAREVIPVLEEIGSEQEDAARTLGANDWQIFWRVTLPNIRWGLLYGLLLTNARAMGEFGAVSVVSGSIIGRTATLPIFVEQTYKNYQTQSAFSAALILALLAGLTLIFKEILERKTTHSR
ncbi:sulfate ABC transporter permease subunit CysW [Gloeocapsa sp. PCC 73106]|uniref:sulfate ABC transporter permease subunit CysW n=1 Tax=Gloeocapsa sp. PCC 73106 TaxID=102232 RepID=UPI0002AC1408|nr:sulfate ABC transporter permease subunit CysW [Gloeocapsa sp. PCC 73106]ELR99167.1 sulfate ABC transporter, permease protein CysW [Gloeocapsa sp. PCC 73106]